MQEQKIRENQQVETLPIATPNEISLTDVSSLYSIEQDIPDRKPPSVEWRIAHSMIAPELIRSFEYEIQVIKWIDGKPNEYYNRIIIHPIEKGNFIEFTNEEDRQHKMRVEIKNLAEISKSNKDDPIGVKISPDVTLQLSYFIENRKNLISPVMEEHVVLMNVMDASLDDVPEMIKNLKNIETSSVYWVKIEKTINERVYDMNLLVPFFGLQEQIIWHNMLVTNNKNVNQISRLQVITNLRILLYDYLTHEGRNYPFQSFDAVDIRPNSERNPYLYESDIGEFSQPINHKEFRPLKSPKDIIFLLKGEPVFTFNEVEESEKLLKVIDENGKANCLS